MNAQAIKRMNKCLTGRFNWRRTTAFSVSLFSAISCVTAKSVEELGSGDPDFTSMSLEQLGAIKVTSVSKKAEALSGAPSAISVITGEEIHRSGATTLPEALRLAPGVNVAKVDAMVSAVSVRGFNDTLSQKLLVMMDGRSVYTPLFSGTFWQAQDTVLEDIDRIEVIRGPGATIWGANAVNGVINIVSKPASETQGFLVTAGGGTAHEAMSSVRYGAKVAEKTFFRVYGKYDLWDRSDLVLGGPANDGGWKAQGGFRLDWEPATENRFTFQGDIYGLEADHTSPRIILPQFMAPPPPTGYQFDQPDDWIQNGGNLLGRWTRQFSEDSELSVQTYYDRSRLKFLLLEETRDTFDADVRHRFQAGDRNEIVWGGGYRLSDSREIDSPQLSLSRDSRTDSIFNTFVQDEVELIPETLRWTLGSKVEHNDYTGWEVEPGTRLAWTITDKQTLWASVARAVRTPSQIERDGRFQLAVFPPNAGMPLPAVVTAVGGAGFSSEELIAYELGYRIQPHQRLSVDLALFVNDYDHLRGAIDRLNLNAVPNYTELEVTLDNSAYGYTYGGELTAIWQATDWWRLQGQASLLESELKQPPTSMTVSPRGPSLEAPEYQLSLRSSMDLLEHVTLDFFARYVDQVLESGLWIPTRPLPGNDIPGYATFDVRLAWRPARDFELSLVGQNLAGTHREFSPTFISTQYTEVGPSAYAKLVWKF